MSGHEGEAARFKLARPRWAFAWLLLSGDRLFLDYSNPFSFIRVDTEL